jgi:hypothetical protein
MPLRLEICAPNPAAVVHHWREKLGRHLLYRHQNIVPGLVRCGPWNCQNADHMSGIDTSAGTFRQLGSF